MEFDNNRPIYAQIKEWIEQQMISGNMMPGEKLPSVRELSVKLKVNPTTIQRTYKELEQEGLTFTKRGMGSFVTEEVQRITDIKDEIAKSVTQAYIERMESIGIKDAELEQLIMEYLEERK